MTIKVQCLWYLKISTELTIIKYVANYCYISIEIKYALLSIVRMI